MRVEVVPTVPPECLHPADRDVGALDWRHASYRITIAEGIDGSLSWLARIREIFLAEVPNVWEIFHITIRREPTGRSDVPVKRDLGAFLRSPAGPKTAR